MSRAREIQLGRARTTEQPQPDKFDTHEFETRWLELSVSYDDGAAIFSGPRQRGYYAHATVIVEERRPGSGFIGRKFTLFGAGRKAFLAPAKRFSQKQLEDQAFAFLRNVTGIETLVQAALETTSFSLPPGALVRALNIGDCADCRTLNHDCPRHREVPPVDLGVAL